MVQELTDLKGLLDAGLLTAPELQDLKTRLLSEVLTLGHQLPAQTRNGKGETGQLYT